MKRSAVLLVLVAALVLSGTALAAGSLAIRRHGFAGGGGQSEAGGFTLYGSVGVPIASAWPESGTGIGAGFWPGLVRYSVYLPMAVKSY